MAKGINPLPSFSILHCSPAHSSGRPPPPSISARAPSHSPCAPPLLLCARPVASSARFSPATPPPRAPPRTPPPDLDVVDPAQPPRLNPSLSEQPSLPPALTYAFEPTLLPITAGTRVRRASPVKQSR